jgi:hypothetical protein
MQCSNTDWEGAEDDCGDDQESDRHSEQDPLSVRTAQTARCSGEEQHQREDHGEDGVAVSRWLNGLASPDPGKYNAVGAHTVRTPGRRLSPVVGEDAQGSEGHDEGLRDGSRLVLHSGLVRTGDQRQGGCGHVGWIGKLGGRASDTYGIVE